MDKEEKQQLEEDLWEIGIPVDAHGLPWYQRFIFRFFPQMVMHTFAKKMGADYSMLEVLDKAFHRTQHVDIFPFSPKDGGQRGFMLVLGNKLAFYFYQDGESFRYDGYEMGEYEKGNVAVFDETKVEE
jgi:hypothetical protein